MAVGFRFRAPAFLAVIGLTLAVGVSSTAARAVAADPVPGPPDLDVASYVVADYDTGQILAERAPHKALYPASTLKVLTAVTLIPRLSPTLAVTPQASDFAAEPDGSVVGMTAGVTYTVADLWRATFLESANDAVAELAHLSGGVDNTVTLMQQRARALGADDTVVADADGYDVDGQVTSAYDLALLARAGLHIPAFRTYCALRQATFPGPDGKTIPLKSHDPMLLSYPGMIGVKGGITTKAGHTYVGAATRDGHTIIETLMLGGTDIFDQAARLMDWGFTADGRVTPVGALGGGNSALDATKASPTPSPSTATSPTPTPTPTTPTSSQSPTTPTASATDPSPSQASTVPDPGRVTITLIYTGAPPSTGRTTPSGPINGLEKASRSTNASDPLSPHALWWGLAAAAFAAAIPITVLATHRRRP